MQNTKQRHGKSKAVKSYGEKTNYDCNSINVKNVLLKCFGAKSYLLEKLKAKTYEDE